MNTSNININDKYNINEILFKIRILTPSKQHNIYFQAFPGMCLINTSIVDDEMFKQSNRKLCAI